MYYSPSLALISKLSFLQLTFRNYLCLSHSPSLCLSDCWQHKLFFSIVYGQINLRYPKIFHYSLPPCLYLHSSSICHNISVHLNLIPTLYLCLHLANLNLLAFHLLVKAPTLNICVLHSCSNSHSCVEDKLYQLPSLPQSENQRIMTILNYFSVQHNQFQSTCYFLFYPYEPSFLEHFQFILPYLLVQHYPCCLNGILTLTLILTFILILIHYFNSLILDYQ